VVLEEAKLRRERKKRERSGRGKPEHARDSLFTQEVRAVRRWLYGTATGEMPWRVGVVDAPRRERREHARQAYWLFLVCPRPADG
jgi:hypothetical protein